MILRGTGGVGKSQLAGDYARAALEAGQLDVLLWVVASSRAAVISAYAQAAEEALGADVSDPERAARRFLGALEPRPAAQQAAFRWLIVFDDLSDPADMAGLWPPESRLGQTVVTTRRRDLSLGGQRLVEVSVFTVAQAVAYMARFLGEHGRHDDAPDQVSALAADLGCLPLALSQASAYLVDADIPIDCPPQCVHDGCDSYRRQLADRATKLEDVLPDLSVLRDDQTTSVAAAWSLSIDRAQALRPMGLARPMLQLASVLDANGIPAAVLTSSPATTYLATHRPDAGESTEARPVTSQDATAVLRVLHRLSLIDHTRRSHEQTVRVHHLIQRTVRDSLTSQVRTWAAKAAADALMAAWPDTELESPLVQAMRFNTAALHQHVDDCLYGDGPHPVLIRYGTSLGESGQAAEAARHFQEVHRSVQERLGLEHRASLIAQSHLAHWVGEAGHAPGAVAHYEQILASHEGLLGGSHPETLTTRSLLARWIGEAGRPVAAVTAFRGILADRERELGRDHPHTLRTRDDLVEWLEKAEGPTAALAEMERLLADSLEALDGSHRHILTRRHNLARLLGAAGDPAAAVKAHRQVLADKERVLGDNHPSTLITRFNLAYWIEKAGDPAAAAGVYREVLADRERLLGPGHPDTLDTRNNLALCLGWGGAPDGAAAALRQLLPDAEKVLGRDHPRVLSYRQSLAHWLGEAGDLQAALDAHEGTLADKERVLGRDHPESLRTRMSYLHYVGETGDPGDALVGYRELLADVLRVFGPESPDALRVSVNLARWMGETGDLSGAVKAYEEILAVRERVLGPNHPDTVSTRGYLARWRQEIDRDERGEGFA